MDRHHKRPRLSFDPRHNDAHGIEDVRRHSEQRFRSNLEALFEKYGGADDDGDLIDLETGQVVDDTGHLRHMRHDGDLARQQSRFSRHRDRYESFGESSEDELNTPSRTKRRKSIKDISHRSSGPSSVSQSSSHRSQQQHAVAQTIPPLPSPYAQQAPQGQSTNMTDPATIALISQTVTHTIMSLMQNQQLQPQQSAHQFPQSLATARPQRSSHGKGERRQREDCYPSFSPRQRSDHRSWREPTETPFSNDDPDFRQSIWHQSGSRDNSSRRGHRPDTRRDKRYRSSERLSSGSEDEAANKARWTSDEHDLLTRGVQEMKRQQRDIQWLQSWLVSSLPDRTWSAIKTKLSRMYGSWNAVREMAFAATNILGLKTIQQSALKSAVVNDDLDRGASSATRLDDEVDDNGDLHVNIGADRLQSSFTKPDVSKPLSSLSHADADENHMQRMRREVLQLARADQRDIQQSQNVGQIAERWTETEQSKLHQVMIRMRDQCKTLPDFQEDLELFFPKRDFDSIKKRIIGTFRTIDPQHMQLSAAPSRLSNISSSKGLNAGIQKITDRQPATGALPGTAIFGNRQALTQPSDPPKTRLWSPDEIKILKETVIRMQAIGAQPCHFRSEFLALLPERSWPSILSKLNRDLGSTLGSFVDTDDLGWKAQEMARARYTVPLESQTHVDPEITQRDSTSKGSEEATGSAMSKTRRLEAIAAAASAKRALKTTGRDKSIPLITRRADGKWIELRCPDCAAKHHRDVKDLVEHCEQIHNRVFQGYVEVIKNCGREITGSELIQLLLRAQATATAERDPSLTAGIDAAAAAAAAAAAGAVDVPPEIPDSDEDNVLLSSEGKARANTRYCATTNSEADDEWLDPRLKMSLLANSARKQDINDATCSTGIVDRAEEWLDHQPHSRSINAIATLSDDARQASIDDDDGFGDHHKHGRGQRVSAIRSRPASRSSANDLAGKESPESSASDRFSRISSRSSSTSVTRLPQAQYPLTPQSVPLKIRSGTSGGEVARGWQPGRRSARHPSSEPLKIVSASIASSPKNTPSAPLSRSVAEALGSSAIIEDSFQDGSDDELGQ